MNGAQALIRTLVDSGVDVCFANPGTSEMHFVAALDDVPEMRAVLGLFEGVVTGAADGYGRMADAPGCDAAAPRSRARQRHREPAQRAPGAHADRQHRRRPRHLPPPVRRAARVRHRRAREQRVGLAAHVAPDRGHRGRRGRRGGRGPAPAGPGRDADPPGRRLLARGRRPVAPRQLAERDAVADEAVAVVAKALQSGEPVALLLGSAVVRERGLRGREPHRRGDRRQAPRRDVPDAGIERGAGFRRSTASATWPSSRSPSSRARAISSSSTRRRRCRSSRTRTSRAPSCRRTARCTSSRAVRRRRRRARTAGRRGRARATRTRSSRPRPARPPDRPDHRRDDRRRARRAPARGRDRRRRGPDRRALGRRRDRGRAPPRLAHPDRRGDRDGHAPRHGRGRRVPRPPGDQPRGRRQRDVHLQALWTQAREGARRHDDRLHEPLLRDPQPGAEPGRRRGAGPEGARACST